MFNHEITVDHQSPPRSPHALPPSARRKMWNEWKTKEKARRKTFLDLDDPTEPTANASMKITV